MGLELERKFLLQDDVELNNATILYKEIIEQNYLALTYNEEVRIRKVINCSDNNIYYTHTYKKKHDVRTIRNEIEYIISEAIYQQLLGLANSKSLIKERTYLIYENINMQLDNYKQFNLITIEIEFKNINEMNNFVIPQWFCYELSGNNDFSNKYLWKNLQKKEL